MATIFPFAISMISNKKFSTFFILHLVEFGLKILGIKCGCGSSPKQSGIPISLVLEITLSENCNVLFSLIGVTLF